MKINVCVNGTFRYPDYIRHYAEAGALGRFTYSHRRSTDPSRLGLPRELGRNLWAKEYALQAVWRGLPARFAAALESPICDRWQEAVIRAWTDCDTVEAVIGAIADRVVAFAKRRGCRVIGHPVCAHPQTVATHVGRAFAELGLDPAEAMPTALSRRLAEVELCDRILVDSRFVAQSYVASGVDASRIVVVCPGVDPVRFRPRRPGERDRSTFRVVCVGTITPRKGQHLLLEAWRRLRLPRAELVLVGLPGLHAAAVTRGNLGSYVHHPRIPHAALRDLLVRASVFVLPSVEDGFAQAAFEAMACGLPVIVSSHVGMSDSVRHEVDGFVVPAFDVDAIAAHLELLYRDEALADGMGEAAATTAHAGGGWPAYAGRVLALHRTLLAGSHTEALAA